jgi:integrase
LHGANNCGALSVSHAILCSIKMEHTVMCHKINLKTLDKARYSLDVLSYSLPKFDFNTLSTQIDENGEIQVVKINYEEKALNKSMFLYWIQVDRVTGERFVEGINDANSYLLDLLVNKSLQDVSIYSRGLIHYFSKLAEWQNDWRDMPHIQSKRPTYRFKKFLEDSYRSSDKEEHIAATTAKAYMNAVVSFYKFYLSKGVKFENAPFNFEEISVKIGTDETNFIEKRIVVVQTTDIRPRIPRSAAGVIPIKLRSLSDREWEILDKILRIERKVLKSEFGGLTKCSLPIELSLIFLLMRHCGLRRQEALTVNEALLINIVSKIDATEFITIEIGPKQGVSTKNEKQREIEVPIPLVQQLHNYTLTHRYIRRRNKFITLNHQDTPVPLFLNQSGFQMSKSTINARWCEIRHFMTHKLGYYFMHKTHNLRSTYAVKRLDSLSKTRMPLSIALEHIQLMLGHESLTTTFHYLSQVEGRKSAEELAEIALDHLYEIEDMEIR